MRWLLVSPAAGRVRPFCKPDELGNGDNEGAKMTRPGWGHVLVLAAAWLWSVEAVQAQSYPARNVTVTVPFAASSASTLVTRLLADKKTRTQMTMVPFTEWKQLLLTLAQGDIDWMISSFGTARSCRDHCGRRRDSRDRHASRRASRGYPERA